MLLSKSVRIINHRIQRNQVTTNRNEDEKDEPKKEAERLWLRIHVSSKQTQRRGNDNVAVMKDAATNKSVNTLEHVIKKRHGGEKMQQRKESKTFLISKTG